MIERENQHIKRMNEIELKYAYTAEGDLIHISEANSGMQEDYLCPKCGNALIAKKGEIRTHHFAHYNFEECTGAQETALHLMAKDILANNLFIARPQDEPHKQPEYIRFDDVELEYREHGLIYDALGTQAGNKVAIEFQVTHPVDFRKKEIVIKKSINMIEVDLSDYLNADLNKDELEKAVLVTAPRHWINNQTTNKEDNNMQNKITMIGFKMSHGYSRKYSSDFEKNRVFVLQEIELKNTQNYTVSDCGGYYVTELDISNEEELINKISQWSYPKEVTLSIDNVLKKGRFTTLVTDIN